MLTRLYSTEHPETHFCAFAPGVVDTPIQDELLSREPDERYAAVEALRAKRGTAEMPRPQEAAGPLLDALETLPRLVSSGAFADIRSLRG
mgnify:CR=1 FL=1